MVPVASITRAESGLGTAGGLMGKVRLSLDQSVAVAANIRTLRLARGWPQRHIADLMEWGHNSVTCRAEGRGNGPARSASSRCPKSSGWQASSAFGQSN